MLHQDDALAWHEKATLQAIAERFATLDLHGKAEHADKAYIIPTGTLHDLDEARQLGIVSERDFFGGIVPQPFAGTKAITHGLVGPDALATAGWLPAFPDAVKDVVLAGFTAFSRRDAMLAGERLLQSGPVRLKPVLARGGTGQVIVTDRQELEAGLDALAEPEISECGLVLEENLNDVSTYSVGQLRVADMTVTYCGTQNVTTDNRGRTVYGGSDLIVARGDYETLMSVRLPQSAMKATELARTYDEAADRHIPGFLASRRNYDVAQGRRTDGLERFGVLEQSWRIGGASTAEVLALEAFHADAELAVVRVASIETYGAGCRPPDGAEVFFQGDDPATGPMLKFAAVRSL
ncbi:DUF3182 family protein [Paracoccus beibuensis]|uniref:DUF3182 family protein n=1 Tax=Paracoccus beibuensis TaxID=547602 RepID=UPI00223F6067|nr:DUF3182 family protein [Paracoccus beibuensis]